MPQSEKTVLLGVTGGIAAYKAAWLASKLVSAGQAVDVVMTEAAERFVTPLTFAALTGRPVYDSLWERNPERIAHIALAERARLAVVAPATANTIAKLALGLADNLLSSVLLAYAGPLVVAPAMNAGMWSHPATQQNVATLKDRGATVLGPAAGRLACGTVGPGRMVEPQEILEAVLARLDQSGQEHARA